MVNFSSGLNITLYHLIRSTNYRNMPPVRKDRPESQSRGRIENKAWKKAREEAQGETWRRAHGLCSRGLVPKFYRSIEDLNPTEYAPHLWMFKKDEYPPKGVILEYVEWLTKIYYINFIEKRMDNLMSIYKEIQAVGVYHNDIHPRNLMVFEDEVDPKTERAM
ncbi:hypothetical protein BDV19DRAFT_385679 [Aspergillus venezuelensis]